MGLFDRSDSKDIAEFKVFFLVELQWPVELAAVLSPS